jgi:membrane protein required for colicin V production
LIPIESIHIGWVDIGMILVLAVSVIVGTVRGFVFELLSLAGWLAAWIAAQWFGPDLAPHLPIGVPGSPLNLGAGYVVTFVAALVVWTVGARLVRLLIHATPLSLIDRVLGAGFGLLRGAVLLLAVSTVVAFTPAARSQPWQDSVGAAWLGAALQGLKPVLPDDVARHLPV